MKIDFKTGEIIEDDKKVEVKQATTPNGSKIGKIDFTTGEIIEENQVKKPADIMTGKSYAPGKEPKQSSVYTPTVKVTEVKPQPVIPADPKIETALNIKNNLDPKQPIPKSLKDSLVNIISNAAEGLNKSVLGQVAGGIQSVAGSLVSGIKTIGEITDATSPKGSIADKIGMIPQEKIQKIEDYQKEREKIKYKAPIDYLEEYVTTGVSKSNLIDNRKFLEKMKEDGLGYAIENTLFSQLPQQALIIGSAMVTGGAGPVASGYLLEAGSMYQQMKASGLSDKKASEAATLYAIPATIIENSTGITAKDIAGVFNEPIKDIVKQTIKKIAINFGKKVFEEGVLEEAVLQNTLQNVISDFYTTKRIDKSVKDYLSDPSNKDALINAIKTSFDVGVENFVDVAITGAITAIPMQGAMVIKDYSNYKKQKIKELTTIENPIIDDSKIIKDDGKTSPDDDKKSYAIIKEEPNKTVVTEEVPSKTQVKETTPQFSENVEQNIGEIKNVPEKDLTLEVVSKEQPIPEIKSIKDFMEPTKAREIAKNYDLKPVQVEISPEEYYSISPDSIALMKEDGLTFKDGKTLPLISENIIAKYNLPESIVNRINEIRSSLKDTSKWTLEKTKTGYKVSTGNGAYEEITPKKVKITKEEKAEAPIIDQKKLKTLYETSPELQANPKLVVDTDKNLVFKSDKQTIKINPEALKLNKENLKEGDVIKIDPDLLSGKGELRVMEKTPTGKNVYANEAAGGFMPEGEINREATTIKTETINRIHLPELVKLAKDFAGVIPKVKNLGASKGGYFRSGMPKEVVINTNLFEAGREEELAAVLSHELGHAVDMLPHSAGKKQNLLGKIYNLNVYMKNTIAKTIVTNNTIKKELSELSKWWTPYNDAEVPKKYKAYRNSAKELYAQYISVLFSAPQEAMNRAPQFSTLFFENLDKKPSFRRTYFEIQDAINNTNLISSRVGRVEDMFKKGSLKAWEMENIRQEQAKEKGKPWRNFKREFVADNEIFIKQRKEKIKRGEIIDENKDPEYFTNERKYVGSKVKAMFEKRFVPILENIKKDSISDIDLGKTLFYERILKGDRGEVANPGGFQKEFIEEMLGENFTDPDAKINEKSLRGELGEDRFNKLTEEAKNFRKALKNVFEEGYKAGLYNDDVYKLISESDFYVPFKPVKYIDRKTTFGVKKQVGTFEDIENPVVTAMQKAAAIVSQIEQNTAKKVTVQDLIKNFPEDIKKAETRFNGKIQEFVPPVDKSLGTLFFYENGKLQAYYVEKQLADLMNNITPETSKFLSATIGLMNNTWLKPIFTTVNAGFQIVNFARKDILTYWKQTNVTLKEILVGYFKAFKSALAKGFDMPDPTVLKMYEEGILNGTYYEIMSSQDMSPEDFQLEKIKKRYNLSNKSLKYKINILNPLKKILSFIESVGATFEAVPKIAEYNRLSKFGEVALSMKEKDYIRRYVGSPDFLARGTQTGNANVILLFGNAMVQGQRSAINAMSNPKTRAGYWYKTVLADIIPKLLMFAATMGWLGKEIKDEMDKVSEYRKTNSIIIPLPPKKDGTGRRIIIPLDQAGQLIQAVFWKTLQMFNKDADKSKILQDIVAGFIENTMPTVTPAITTSIDIYKYFTGQNIYDSFKDRNVFTDEQMLIGGVDKAKTFGKYVYNEFGGSSIFPLDYSKEGKISSAYDVAIKIPMFGTIFKRFYSEGNTGLSEINKSIIRKDLVEIAKRNNALKKFSEKYMKEFFKGAKQTVDARDNIIDKALDDWEKQNPNVTDEVYDQATKYIKTKLIQLTNKNIDNELFNSLTTYGIPNSAKIKLLNEYKKKMPAKDFENILYDLKDFGVISQAVYNSIE